MTKSMTTARVRQAAHVFADGKEHTGGMIALVPDQPTAFTVPGGDPASEMHCTLVYLGDNVASWPSEIGERLRGDLARLAGMRGPITAHVLGIAQWNRDGGPTGEFEPCTVTQLQGGNAIQSIRDHALDMARHAMGGALLPKQHEPFLPHVTAGFKVEGEPKAKGRQVFSQIRLALGGIVYDFPLSGIEPQDEMGYQAKDVIEMADTKTKAAEAETDTAVPAYFPCLAVEGMQTGDGRYIEPGGLTARAMPLTIWAQTKNTGQGGHSGAEVVGKLTEAWKIPGQEFISRQTGKPLPEGTFVWQGRGEVDTATEGGKLAAKGYLVGNSIDLGAADFADEVLFNDDGTEEHRVTVTKAELAATTLCAIPAFPDAYVELDGKQLSYPEGLDQEATLADLYKIITDAGYEPVTASMMIEGYDQCSPCLFTAQEEMGKLPPALQKKADAKKAQAKDDDGDDSEEDDDGDDGKPLFLKRKIAGAKGGKAKARTASSGAGYPPIDAFSDPGFPEPTPLTIDGDRIFGHIATWNTCHIGISKRCTPPPKSASDYAYFNTGAKRVRDHDGEIRTVGVGHLTMNTGHASLAASTAETLAHYDNTGTVAATVAAGEDRHGIWINGMVEPDLSDADREKLAAAPPSGDWRPVNGRLELCAVLAVNVPGYPVPRARVASVGDGETEVVALVAAGATRPATDFGPGGLDYQELARRIAQELAPAFSRPIPPFPETQAAQGELAAELAGLEQDALLDELEALVPGELTEDVIAWVEAVLPEVRNSDETFQLLADNLAEGTGKVSTFDELQAASTFNWVDKVGGLPKFITRIKKHLMKKGMTESHAIATAVNVVKKMCATGDTNFPGKQNVNAGSKAEACAAAASWEAKKARAKSS